MEKNTLVCICGDAQHVGMEFCLKCGRDFLDDQNQEIEKASQKREVKSKIKIPRKTAVSDQKKLLQGWYGFFRTAGASVFVPRLYAVKGPLNSLSEMQTEATYKTESSTNLVGVQNRGLFVGQARTSGTTREQLSFWIPLLQINGIHLYNLQAPDPALYNILVPGGNVGLIHTKNQIRLVVNHSTGAKMGQRPSLFAHYLFILILASIWYLGVVHESNLTAMEIITHGGTLFFMLPILYLFASTLILRRNWKTLFRFCME